MLPRMYLAVFLIFLYDMLELAEFDYAKAMELDAGNEDFAFNHVDIQIGRAHV